MNQCEFHKNDNSIEYLKNHKNILSIYLLDFYFVLHFQNEYLQ